MNNEAVTQQFDVEYPDLTMIRAWYFMLKENDEFQKAFYLPAIDGAWCEQMLSAFQTTAIRPDCRTNIKQAAACVFYKITKNHYRVDGNKRSAVICIFFFFLVNGFWLNMPSIELYELSRELAMSKSQNEGKEIDRIASRFGLLLRTF
ncbi:MAG: hypothetical protein ABII13_05620 [Patescibacteria group bacterium]